MIAGVADTHAALWYVLKNERLSQRTRLFMDDAAAAGNSIAVSSISLAEILYLTEKNRLPAPVYATLKTALADPSYVIEEISLSGNIVDAMAKVSRTDVPDMPDRIVAATAVHFSVPVISRDGKIRASAVETIW